MTRLAFVMLLGCVLLPYAVSLAQDQATPPTQNERALGGNQEQPTSGPTATQCKLWNDSFRQAFGYYFMGAIVLTFLVPLIISALPRKHWFFIVPWRRTATVAVVVLALSVGACVVLPWLSLRDWVRPGIGLIAYGYGGVADDYVQCGPPVQFEAPLFLGLFGLANTAAITQLTTLLLLLTGACLLGALASFVLQHFLAHSRGLQASAREVKA